jgi:hypothetical protein
MPMKALYIADLADNYMSSSLLNGLKVQHYMHQRFICISSLMFSEVLRTFEASLLPNMITHRT